jgi:hypothetical protein
VPEGPHAAPLRHTCRDGTRHCAEELTTLKNLAEGVASSTRPRGGRTGGVSSHYLRDQAPNRLHHCQLHFLGELPPRARHRPPGRWRVPPTLNANDLSSPTRIRSGFGVIVRHSRTRAVPPSRALRHSLAGRTSRLEGIGAIARIRYKTFRRPNNSSRPASRRSCARLPPGRCPSLTESSGTRRMPPPRRAAARCRAWSMSTSRIARAAEAQR